MNRPLLITDCDEVLLHMISHFANWVAEAHGLSFDMTAPGFRNALLTKDGAPVPAEEVWPLLDGFLVTEMHRQNVVPGAVEALRRIGEVADVIILTNIGVDFEAARVEQLERFEIRHRVLCNQGGKGPPVAELVAEMKPSAIVFVDDLPVHHKSVAEHAPEVWRLHMIAEPRLAAHTPPAPDAHARIDDWADAAPWVLERLAEGRAPTQGSEETNPRRGE